MGPEKKEEIDIGQPSRNTQFSEDGESKLVLYLYFLPMLFLHFTTMLTFLMHSFNYVTIGLKTFADSPLVNQVQTSQLGNGKDSKPSMIWSYSMQTKNTSFGIGLLGLKFFRHQLLALFLSFFIYKKG